MSTSLPSVSSTPGVTMKGIAVSKVWVIAALLAAAGVLLLLRGNVDRVPPHLPLAALPDVVGPWQGQDQVIPDNVLEVLGKGEFLSRVYSTPVPSVPPVSLFIGYFPTQRAGQAIHSPQNCLPGAGWNFDRSGTTTFQAGGKRYTVGEYLISNANTHYEVLYWYRAQGEDIAGDYRAKADMLFNAMMRGRTDAALIRIMTPVVAGETVAAAHTRTITFAQELVPSLPPFLPN